ncbi:MAG TPA: ABC transporter ATP-binding protein [Vicinamibacterales bacterium]|nr:ABC transporter ATP-binding protein [Vicinamibacterales bacterium]
MLLSAGNLRFAYPSGRGLVVDQVSLNIAAGDIVGILGPNGSGKTTLLRLLAGALTPLDGTVALDGQEIARVPRRDLATRIAVVPQETSLAFDYTALEIVLMGRYPHLGAFEIEGPGDLSAATRAIEATGTQDLRDRGFRTLSGGEKQRVVIASALAQLDRGESASHHASGSLLLLDEPTASLDLRYQFEVASVLRRLHDSSNITIVLSTHDLRFAASLCTRIVLLSSGRILAQGTPADVLTPALVGRLFEVPPELAAPILASAHRP